MSLKIVQDSGHRKSLAILGAGKGQFLLLPIDICIPEIILCWILNESKVYIHHIKYRELQYSHGKTTHKKQYTKPINMHNYTINNPLAIIQRL
jgi:hypothetical protein